MKVRYFIYGLILILGVFLDQWTKQLVVKNIQNSNDFLHLLPVLSIVRTHNTGVSFGMLSTFNLGPVFYGILVLSIILFLVYRMLVTQRILMQTAFVLMISGAVGNLIDRCMWGYVVDFISAHWFEKYHFYVFNVADIFVSCGAGLIILDAIIEKRTS
ncbi:MAG: signal peptidase II [Candidatus Paracaedibacteraceae bacterium]|nr:signal peptidase II [Candidatus Paracaedibacteraceae bacterium]